mmetsp:Transcript_1929/g.2698  ORF Transcript_1929/g.2698 Transcript_1929/m.2698 type:complete len:120 (-) Transcript_1929:29-388(-)
MRRREASKANLEFQLSQPTVCFLQFLELQLSCNHVMLRLLEGETNAQSVERDSLRATVTAVRERESQQRFTTQVLLIRQILLNKQYDHPLFKSYDYEACTCSEILKHVKAIKNFGRNFG